ncbi:MAG: N4-gp56 family major capsid protein [Clostridia bacterium]|nr:N4-gp56 family major capsid protein [Clostridia bacterium]
MKQNQTKMLLQLFAEPTVNVTTAAASGNDLSAEMQTFYDMTLIDEAGPELVHDQFGQKRPIPAGGGKTIQFRRFSPLPKATTPLTEGVTPAGNKLNVSKVEATVSQYGDYLVQSDVLELTAIDNTIAESVKLLGKQAGITLDTVVRNVLQSGTNVWYAPAISAGGMVTELSDRSSINRDCPLTVDLVKKVAAWMRANNVPKINGSYVAIIHPNVAFDLMKDEKWEDYHKYAAPENLYEGELGRIAGVRFVESTEAKIYGGEGAGGDSVYGCLFFGDGAYGTTEVTGGGLQTIVKQKGSAGTGDPLDQRSSVGWKALKTAEILVEPYLIRVECGSSFGPKAASN